jgi:phosphoribosylamine--glycine ligase
MALDFVLRCVAADHDVRWYRHGKKTRDGEGFKGFKVITDWKESMPWAKDGLIICTGNFVHIAELDRFRDLGYKIFGPTVKSAELEIKRSVGMEAMKAAGIEIPPYHEFKSLEDAEKFARKSDDCWVFKPMGDESDKSLTFVSCDPAQMVGWIRQKIERGMVLKGSCMLQEKIDLLAEVGVAAWCGPEGFLPDCWEESFEHKKLMNGEIGPATGEQGTFMQRVEKSKLADEVLKPLETALRVIGHSGDFSVNCGIDTKGRAFPFEFTARAGWPAFFIQIASVKGDPAQWMRDWLDGKDSLKMSYDGAIGVVMAQPMYPYNKSTPEMVEGNPISGAEDVIDDLHFASVMMGKGPKWEDGKIVDRSIYQTTGEYVMVATGLGKTVEKARKAVYDVVDQVKFPNAMYRTDIGEKLENSLTKLHGFGYCKETVYS